jgi:hypothetical protein
MFNVVISLQSIYSRLYSLEIEFDSWEEVNKEALDKAMWELCILDCLDLHGVAYADEIRQTLTQRSLVDLIGSWGFEYDIRDAE